ncbi:MAG: hemin uptake protein HemP [Gammaproteobacteria bacterium]|nr:hemin uptake protein HemP [Gammaproteobacteria bacterium]
MSQLHLKPRRITPTIKQVSTTELLGNKKQLQISHNGAEYTLRITSNNKLILTK